MVIMKHLIINNPSYNHYLEGFARHTERLGYAPASRPTLHSHVKEFLHWLERQSLTTITTLKASHIKSHYRYLKERPSKQGGCLSSSMVTSHIYAIRLFIEYLQQEGYLTANPMGSVIFERTGYKERDVLSREEIRLLYNTSDTLRDIALLSLLYGCGLRRTEAILLDIPDIYFRTGMLYVRRGKGSKRREVPMSDQVRDDLKEYCYNERSMYISSGNQETTGAFLITNKGKRVSGQWMWYRIKRLVRLSGIKDKRITLHTLRHTIATHLLENGMSVEYVRLFLGHRCLESTQRYTRITNKQTP
jgi:integrase/recombinase XerD